MSIDTKLKAHRDDLAKIKSLLDIYDHEIDEFYEELPANLSASGIYILWSSERLEYIGQSVNISQRLANHPIYKRGKAGIDLIGIVSVADDFERDVIEIALIGLMNPTQNMQWRTKNHTNGWQRRKNLKLFSGSVPTGYRHSGYYQPAEIDEKKAAGVRRAFQLYATGQYSLIDLCSKLNDEGYRVKSGKRYSYRSLHSILTNRNYTGKLHIKGQWVTSNELMLIDEELFNQVQDVMRERARAPRSVSRKFSAYLLNGLLYCVHCGRKLYAQRDWAQRGARYKDSSYFKRLTCPADKLIEHGEGVLIKEIDLVPQVEAILQEHKDQLVERCNDSGIGPIVDIFQLWQIMELSERHDLLVCLFDKIWVDRVTQKIVKIDIYEDFGDVFQADVTLTANDRLFIMPADEWRVNIELVSNGSGGRYFMFKELMRRLYNVHYGQLPLFQSFGFDGMTNNKG